MCIRGIGTEVQKAKYYCKTLNSKIPIIRSVIVVVPLQVDVRYLITVISCSTWPNSCVYIPLIYLLLLSC